VLNLNFSISNAPPSPSRKPLHATLMRPVIIIATLLFFISCTDTVQKIDIPQGWTEVQKRRFYTDSFAFTDRDFPDRRDSVTSFQSFMDKHYPDLKAKNKYDPFIYAMEEQYIDTTQIDTSKHWFRLTVKPVFRKPYCLILTKDNDKSFLTTKATNGDGGYNTGTLTIQLRFQFQDTLYDNTLRNLEDIRFWTLPIHDTTCGPGLDGETWTFELIDSGKYQILNRWVPQSCGDSLTKKLSNVGLKIRELSRLDKVLTALGERKSGM
jgi:hypothetical protein